MVRRTVHGYLDAEEKKEKNSVANQGKVMQVAFCQYFITIRRDRPYEPQQFSLSGHLGRYRLSFGGLNSYTFSPYPTPPITPLKHHRMPPQQILPPRNPMPLILKTQKLTLDALPLTHIKRGQTITNGTSIIQIRMNDQHRCLPISGMACGIPFVEFGLMGPEGAFEVGGEGGG